MPCQKQLSSFPQFILTYLCPAKHPVPSLCVCAWVCTCVLEVAHFSHRWSCFACLCRSSFFISQINFLRPSPCLFMSFPPSSRPAPLPLLFSFHKHSFLSLTFLGSLNPFFLSAVSPLVFSSVFSYCILLISFSSLLLLLQLFHFASMPLYPSPLPKLLPNCSTLSSAYSNLSPLFPSPSLKPVVKRHMCVCAVCASWKSWEVEGESLCGTEDAEDAAV